MDETIGSFKDINLIYRYVERYINLHELLTIFKKEVFRPCIFDIFKTIVNLKHLNEVNKVILYTNNNGGYDWPSKIVNYIHEIIPGVFDDIIYGLHVSSGNIPDIRRKYYHKHMDDIRTILEVCDDTSFLFLDDVEHPYMRENNVKYILLNPYNMTLRRDVVLKKLNNHPLFSFIRVALNNYSIDEYDHHHGCDDNESVRMIRSIIEFVELNP